MHARNDAVSPLVKEFGSSSVYVSCSEVSNAGTPSAALKGMRRQTFAPVARAVAPAGARSVSGRKRAYKMFSMFNLLGLWDCRRTRKVPARPQSLMSYDASMVSWARSVFACAMAISAYSGCDSEDTCGAIAVVVPVITVADGTTRKPICDATVMAICADGGAALVAFGPGGYPVDAAVPGCNYGPGLQNGCDVSTVTVSKTGYRRSPCPTSRLGIRRIVPGQSLTPSKWASR